jgi:preprotein translocase subunit SecD
MPVPILTKLLLCQFSMSMNAEGAKTWARMTRDNIGKSIAIVLDGYVYSYPTVQNEITGGNSQITGHFTVEEAKDMANVLKSGKMPALHELFKKMLLARHWVRKLYNLV